jgi:hypothetical protein
MEHIMDLWMQNGNGIFIDIHEELRSYSDVIRFLRIVEEEGVLQYCNGNNSRGRLLFQIFSTEFIQSVADIITNAKGPILEVMAGDGKLVEFLASRVNKEIIATDSKNYTYDIQYPDWILEYDAMQALDDFDPSVVILCWEPLYSDVGDRIAKNGHSLIWIGDPNRCAPKSGLLEREHIRMNSKYAIGRYDSIINEVYNTDIYLFNIDMKN